MVNCNLLWMVADVFPRPLKSRNDEDNGRKIHIGQVLRMLAAAIHEDPVGPLAQVVNQWGTQYLRTGKPLDEVPQ
jgi:hypothetical protein